MCNSKSPLKVHQTASPERGLCQKVDLCHLNSTMSTMLVCKILVYPLKSPPQEVIRAGTTYLEAGMEAQAPQRSAEMIYSPPLGERVRQITLRYSAGGLLTLLSNQQSSRGYNRRPGWRGCRGWHQLGRSGSSLSKKKKNTPNKSNQGLGNRLLLCQHQPTSNWDAGTHKWAWFQDTWKTWEVQGARAEGGKLKILPKAHTYSSLPSKTLINMQRIQKWEEENSKREQTIISKGDFER